MKFHIYCNYNRKVEAYERPLFTIEDPDEYVEHICRDFKASDDLAKSKIADYNIIHIGTFDDNTGKINLTEPNLLLNCSVLVTNVEKEKDNA